MKPRILKKLCKKVAEMVGDKFGKVWIDSDEPFACYYLDRTKENEKCTMTGLAVVGGHLDYWGEATDTHPVFNCARDYVLWELGSPTTEDLKDEDGNVIGELEGWPDYPKRLTGLEVIQKLRTLCV